MEEMDIIEKYKEAKAINSIKTKKFLFKPINSIRKKKENASFEKLLNNEKNEDLNYYSKSNNISFNKISDNLNNEDLNNEKNLKVESNIQSNNLILDDFETFSNNNKENHVKNDLLIDYSKFQKNKNLIFKPSFKDSSKGLEQFLNANNELKDNGSKSSLTSNVSIEINPKQFFEKSELLSEIDIQNNSKKDSNNISINEKYLEKLLENENKSINKFIKINNNTINNIYKKIDDKQNHNKNNKIISKVPENKKQNSYFLLKNQQIQNKENKLNSSGNKTLFSLKKVMNKNNEFKTNQKTFNQSIQNNKKKKNEFKYHQFGDKNAFCLENNKNKTSRNEINMTKTKNFTLNPRNNNNLIISQRNNDNEKEHLLNEIKILKEQLKLQSIKEVDYRIEIEKLKQNFMNKNNENNLPLNSKKSEYFLLNYKNNEITNKNNKIESKEKIVFYKSFSKLFKEFNLKENLIFENIENGNIIDDLTKINYDEIFKKYPQLKTFIQLIINKYKKEKESRKILEEKTLQLLTNDMKTIDTLEKKLKKINKKGIIHKRIKSEINKSISSTDNILSNSVESCNI